MRARTPAAVRKFIILDIYQTQPAVVFALAASLSLGIVFWLVRHQEGAGPPARERSETGELRGSNTNNSDERIEQ